jgi:hypothetical protein
MKITYNIHHFYTPNGILCEPYRTVTVDSSTPQGKEVIRGFDHQGKLYVGACVAGCQITKIEDDTEDPASGQEG